MLRKLLLIALALAPASPTFAQHSGGGRGTSGGGGGGTAINSTDGTLPVRSNSTTFIDSPVTVSGTSVGLNMTTYTDPIAGTVKFIVKSTNGFLWWVGDNGDTSGWIGIKNGTGGSHMGAFQADANAVYIGSRSNSKFYLLSNATQRFYLDTTGHFLANTDNTYDIGASAANRPRTIYAGTGVTTPLLTLGSTGVSSIFGSAPGVKLPTTSLVGDPTTDNCVKWLAGGKLGDAGAACAGGGSSVTGTGFWHSTSGSLDAAAKKVALNDTNDVSGVTGIANGGTGTGSTLTGLVRGNASAMTAAELSGDCTTSGSNAVTCTKINGVTYTTVPVANGGTGQTSAAAARGSSGLNIDSATSHGDSNYTILNTDRWVYTSAAFTAARTWTLPAANAVNAGQSICVVDLQGTLTGTNTLTVQRAGSDTINGGTTVVFSAAFDGGCLVSDGTSKWMIPAATTQVASGGTGVTTLTGIVKGNGTSAFTAATAGTDYVSPSSTETLTNKTLDAEGTGNSITIPTKVWLPAAGCNNATASSFWDLPTSTPAAAACVTGTNTQKGVLDYADTSGGFSAQNTILLPADFSGSADYRIIWTTTATTGNAKWTLSWACTDVAASATDDPSFTNSTSATTAAPGTTNRVQSSSDTSVSLTGCSAGNLLHLKLFRDGNDAADTIAATARLIGVELTIRRAM